MSFLIIFQSLGLHIFAVDKIQHDSTGLEKVMLVQPCVRPMAENQPLRFALSCTQLTDRRVYFTWDNMRRRDIPLFTDEESKLEIIPSPGASAIVETWENARPRWNLDRRHHYL
jgi:hypothetical protein